MKNHCGELSSWGRIEALMRRDRITAKKIAEIAGVVPSAVAKWKTGSLIGADKLDRIARHFGESVDYLLGRTDEKRLNNSDSDFQAKGGADVIYGAAAAAALAKQDREKAAAFSAQDSARAVAFSALAKDLSPLIASGREVDYCAEQLRESLESLIAWGKSLERKPETRDEKPE